VLAVPALALLLWFDPLGEVLGELGGLDPRWLSFAAGLELASCVGYVVVFRRLFDGIAGRPAGKLGWLGLGAGALLPGGNVAGVAASCLTLHRDGVPSRPLVVRSSVLLLMVNGVCVAGTAVAGVLLLSGAGAGPHDLLAAGLPILVSALIAGVFASVPFAVRLSAERAPAWIVPLADAIDDSGRLLRRPDWRLLLGAGAYPLLDMGALWAACAATGHPPSLAALVIAYNVGYLATILPVPAGIGVLDGGLAAALILYGAPSSAAVTAALAYHALAVWVPVIGGLVASAPLHRDHLRRRAPAAVAARAPVCR
jgi:uncharacterized membrane protein YbhN (UPF0104 family)